MRKKDGISVIVPIYNSEKYLEKCITSLLHQNINNYEIILIDDGSTDKSLEICKKFENKRIKVFHKENEGISLTRNFGLAKASYNYISFVDSDDYVTEDFLEEIDKRIKEGYDVVTFDAFETDGQQETYRKCYIPNDSNAKEDFLMQSTEPSFLWCRCFYYKLFQKVKFPNQNLWYEDSATVPLLLEEAENITHIEKPLYYYRQHGSSITRNSINEKNLGILKAWERLLNESKNEYQKEIEYAVYYGISVFINFRPKFCDEFLEFYKKNKDKFIKNSYIEEKIKKQEWINLSDIKLIPKKVHYFQEKDKYLDTWQKNADDYEIIPLNKEKIDVTENDYIKEAYQEKQMEYIYEYHIIKILYEEGGFYLDENIELKKRIDFFRTKNLSLSMEKDNIFTKFICSSPKNKILKDILNSYQNDHFVLEDGSFNKKRLSDRIQNILDEQIHYVGETIEKKDFSLYSPDIVVVDVDNGKNVAEFHYPERWDAARNIGTQKYQVFEYYFETIYKEKIRIQEEERRRKEEIEIKKRIEEAVYENSLKRKIYKKSVKTLNKVLPTKVYQMIRKGYRKIKPHR